MPYNREPLEAEWKEFYQSLGNIIAIKRQEARKTREYVAKVIGLNSVTLARYETGERYPPLHILCKLGRVLASDDRFFLSQASIPGIFPLPLQDPSSLDRHIGSDIYQKIQHRLDEGPDEEASLSGLMRDLMFACNVGVIAVFKYEWATSRLVKFDEEYNPAQRQKWWDEAYNVWRAQYVTERAWAYTIKDDQLVTDYPTLRHTHPDRVNHQSLSWHAQVLGDVLSTMYGILGAPQKRYALRCFNRSDRRRGVLDEGQYELLTSLCSQISVRVSINAKARSLERIRTLCAQLRQDSRGEVQNVLKEVLGATLASEGAPNGVILWETHPIPPLATDQSMVEHVTDQGMIEGVTYGPLFEEWARTRDASHSYTTHGLHERIANNNVPFVVNTATEISSTPAKHTIEAYIQALNNQALQQKPPPDQPAWLPPYIGRVLLFPFTCPMHEGTARQGALLIPVETGGNFATIDMAAAIPDTMRTINTYAGIAGDEIQARGWHHL